MPASTSLSLRRIRPERNERRFYHMEVTIDLFGTVLLQRRWGRIGTDGRHWAEPFSDAATAEAALIRLATTKRRRGYRDAPTPSQ
jgi:predicted DNA-binding WGR domain protein